MCSAPRCVLVGAVCGLGAFGMLVEAQQRADDGAFTAEQATRGLEGYERSCAECHEDDLRGSSHGAELVGPPFLDRWESRTINELFDYIRTSMPPGLAGSLTDESYLTIVAHILQSNGHQSGSRSLEATSAVSVDPASGNPGPAPADVKVSEEAEFDPSRAPRFINAKIASYAPVTDVLLHQPPAADWLSWRRTLDNHGHTPLSQITKDNVSELRLAWVLAMHDGNNQTTPLVHDGVMFLVNPGNVIQALDAATGDVIWVYRYPVPADARARGATRTIALYDDKVFLTTYDAALVALDARTGDELWKTVKADYTQGFMQAGGPIVANGVVVSGINGCERYKDQTCFITGHNPETGAELWRTSTIALPGDPNDASWGDVAPHLRAGGDMWIPGSFDLSWAFSTLAQHRLNPG